MKMFKKYNYLLLLVYLFISSFISNSNAQQLEVNLDKDSILLGDQVSLNYCIKLEGKDYIIYPEWKDSIGKLSIIDIGKWDTIQNNQFIIINNTLKVSVYDSGMFEIPSQKFLKIVNKDTIPFYSDAKHLYSNYVDVDTSKDIQPIIDIIEEDAPDFLTLLKDHLADNKWIYIIITILLLLIILGYWWYRKTRNKSNQVKIYEAPHVKANRLLLDLNASNIWEKGEYKQYFSQLTDILKEYLDETFINNASEMTTRDLLHTVKKHTDLRKIHNELRSILHIADLAKFAKSIPSSDEKDDVWHTAVKIIKATEPTKTNIDNDQQLAAKI